MRGKARTRRTLEEHGMALPWGRRMARAATLCRDTGSAQGFTFWIGDERCQLLLHPRDDKRGVRVEYRTVSGMLLAEVQAVSRTQPYGGAQWYLVCPSCRKHRRRVHMLPKRLLAGAACRSCHELHYVTQRMAPVDRLRHRTRTLYAKASGEHWSKAPDPHDGCDAPTPPRFRKWARGQAEWARWYAACERLDLAWLEEADRGAMKLLATAPGGMRGEIMAMAEDLHCQVAAARRSRSA